jgi:hypothetical protein
MSGIFTFVKSIIGGGGNYSLVDIKSQIDGMVYRVRDMSDKQQAADLLAKVRLRLARFCEHLEKTYRDRPQIKRMVQNFKADPSRFIEATPDAEHTSYSVNKGEQIHLCLRQRTPGNESLVKEEVMVFVAIHELAHTITQSVGHEPEFWNNFAWLLKEAEQIGAYKHTDFAAHPVAYCGVSITDQPTYDSSKDEAFTKGAKV